MSTYPFKNNDFETRGWTTAVLIICLVRVRVFLLFGVLSPTADGGVGVIYVRTMPNIDAGGHGNLHISRLRRCC